MKYNKSICNYKVIDKEIANVIINTKGFANPMRSFCHGHTKFLYEDP